MEESKEIQRYTTWVNAKGIDPVIRRELLNIISSPKEISERFGSDLHFGTAGIRAIMAAGTNRMNIYTIAAVARGLALYLTETGSSDHTVVISWDSRKHSDEFAEITARVLAHSGIHVLLSDEIRPVPMLSFAVSYYNATGGVMITASHNPPEYNGLKVYGRNGAQISASEADAVGNHIPEFEEILPFLMETPSLEELTASGQIERIGAKWDDAYDAVIMKQSDFARISKEARSRTRIVYTPLNGAAAEPVRRILNRCGYQRVFLVSEQEKPDGDFPTLRVPNPEYEDSFELAKKYAKAVIADVIIATDPDGDRLGVAVPDENGEYQVLNGNQIGVMLMEYILSAKSRQDILTKDQFCTTSYVSSRLTRRIAQRYGVDLIETPTGSKYMADVVQQKEKEGKQFLFGFEESNSYLFASSILEKDGISASVAIAEMAAVSKSYGMKLYDQLKAIYRLYGYAAEKTFSITRDGEEGRNAIRRCMEYYRALGGKLGTEGQDLYYRDVKKYTDMMPESDALIYEFNDMDWMALRPSGTEPKIRIYCGFYGERYSAESRLTHFSEMLLKDIHQVLDRK